MPLLILLVFVVLLIFGYGFSIQLLNYLLQDLTQHFKISIITLSPADSIVTILNIDLLLAAAILLPVLILWLISYVTPALYDHERKLLFAYAPVILVLAGLGLFCGWYLSTKIFIPFLQSFASIISVQNNWSLSNLIAFVLTSCFIFMIILQLPVVINILVSLKVFTVRQLAKLRKGVIVTAVIFGALATPTPDIPTQLMVAVPFYLLYELTLQYCQLKEFIKNKK